MDCVSRASCKILKIPREFRQKNESSTGASEADVVVRVAWRIVQVQRLHPCIAAIVPIAAADEPPPAYIAPYPYLSIALYHDV